jgi:hypothetical protein
MAAFSALADIDRRTRRRSNLIDCPQRQGVRGLLDEGQWIGVISPEFHTTEFLISLEGVLVCH